jgi:PAS domain S-box-containing protein
MPSSKPPHSLPLLDQVIDPTLLTVAPNTPVLAAIAQMGKASTRTSYILVLEFGQPVGLLTEPDIVQLVASERELDRLTMATVMVQPVITLTASPEQSLDSVMTLMQQQAIDHLPVMDTQGQLLGMITPQRLNPILLSMVSNIASVSNSTPELDPSALLSARADPSQAEINLQETLRSLEFQKFALDQAAIVAITDRRGVITYVNDKFCQISQYSREELIGRTHRIINSNYHPLEFFQDLWCTISSGKVWQGDIKNRAKHGSFYWVATTIVPFLDQDGKPFQYLAIRFDITPQKQTEATLQETLRSLESQKYALDQSAIVAVTNRRGIITDVNDTFCQISQYSRDELIGQNHRIINSGYHPPEFFQELWSTIAGGKVWQGEIKNRAKDGSFYWVATTIVPFLDREGRLFQYLSIRFDITQQKQTEADLRESQERWLLALRGNNDGIWDWHIRTQAVFFSARWKEMLGYTEAEIGHHLDEWTNRVHPDDLAYFRQIINDHLAQRTQFYVAEYRMQCKDGSYKWILDRGQALWHDQGKAVRMAGSHSDISDRRAAEEKIHEQATLLEVATDAILLRSFNNQILYWNQGATRLYGWSAPEAIGRNTRDLICQGSTSEIETALQTVLETGQWAGELPKVTKDGKKLLVESRWTLVQDEQGQPKSILTVATDITEKKQLERQFLRAQRMESLGTLASGIAHDLNNILTPILAAAQLLPLQITNPNEKSQMLLRILAESASRGSDLVTQVLSFARGVDGQFTIRQVGHLLMELVRVMQQTFPRSIEIERHIPTADLWMVSADATQLHRVFMNLCVNARDAMPTGGNLHITAENLLIDENYARMNIDAKAGPYVVVTIADTGMGIPPEIMERIFEPFFTTKEIGHGTGLGLSTSLGIVKKHGGFVNVYSEVDRGTRFKVYLPATEGTEMLYTADLETLKGNDELILVVDDEASVREITKASLETYNYRAITGSDGIEAITLYAQQGNEIRFVLLDLMMPSLDGINTIRALQRMNPQIQIVAMSGLSSNGAVAQAASAGVNTFLAKPFTAQELLQTLNQLKNR